MNRLAVILLFVAGCSAAQADPWHDYLIALQVHDFELKAVRQAEQIDASPKHWRAAAKVMNERCLICASAAISWGCRSRNNKQPQFHAPLEARFLQQLNPACERFHEHRRTRTQR